MALTKGVIRKEVHVKYTSVISNHFGNFVDRRKKDPNAVLDFYGVLSILVATYLSTFLLRIGCGFLNLPEIAIYSIDLLYFAIPFCMFKFSFGYGTGRSAAYSSAFIIVPTIFSILWQIFIIGIENV